MKMIVIHIYKVHLPISNEIIPEHNIYIIQKVIIIQRKNLRPMSQYSKDKSNPEKLKAPTYNPVAIEIHTITPSFLLSINFQ